MQHRLLQLALLTSDALMLGLAFLLAYRLRFDFGFTVAPEVVPHPDFYPRLASILVPSWIGLFALFRLYQADTLQSLTGELGRVVNACTNGMMLVVVATFIEPLFVVSRAWLIASWILAVLLVASGRVAIFRARRWLRGRGFFVKKAAIIGCHGEAVALARELRDWRHSGLALAGFVGVGNRRPQASGVIPILGDTSQLDGIIAEEEIQELIVAVTCVNREELLEICERANALRDVELRLSSGLFELLSTKATLHTASSIPLVSFSKMRLDTHQAIAKNLLEYSLTILGVLFLLPAVVAISVAIKLDSRGPILYRRRVMGVGGTEFDAFKFRTMYVDGDEILTKEPQLKRQLSKNKKLKSDPRVTPVGKVLRRYSLDELPQLINVLKGQMSLVGPRMIAPEEAEKYGQHRLSLLTVKPGLTGLWQVSGRSDLPYDERVRLDLHYIRSYTLLRDIDILFFRTIPAVLKGRGAY